METPNIYPKDHGQAKFQAIIGTRSSGIQRWRSRIIQLGHDHLWAIYKFMVHVFSAKSLHIFSCSGNSSVIQYPEPIGFNPLLRTLLFTDETSHYSVIYISNSQKYFPIEISDKDFLISESIIKGFFYFDKIDSHLRIAQNSVTHTFLLADSFWFRGGGDGF